MDDRELDALIAEKVMGFHRVVDDTKDADGVRHGNDVLLPPGETLESLEFFLPRKGPMALTCFVHSHYSTDIAAAWQVVEKLTSVSEIVKRVNPVTGLPAGTHFGWWWENVHLWSYTAQEAARAICIAALGAVGEAFV